MLATLQPVVAGGRIALGVTCGNAFALSNVTGGSLTWGVDKTGAPSFFNMYIISAIAPAGLAASTNITANFTGSVSGRSIAGISLTGSPVPGVTSGLTTGTSTAWATASTAINAGSALVALALNQDGNNANTITSPSVEDSDVNAGAATYDAVLAHRIESAAGSVTVAGTWAASVSFGVIAVEYKDAVNQAWVPRRMPLGV